jgi:acetylornithine deacetylase
MACPSPATISLLERLIGFDTTSRESNLALIDFVRAYLASHAVAARLVHDETGRKANLFATIGPADRPGLVLSGHTDVVPIDGQDWSSAPFRLSEHDGRLHGRGTCDMKGFLAVVLAAVPAMARARLSTPIRLAFSYDEEVGCIGVRRLLADLDRGGIRPSGAIIGEPTEMQVVRGHKGKLSIRAQVRGHECHSSIAPRGVNAIQVAARIIAELTAMDLRHRDAGPHDQGFDIPWTTVHTGVIAGGTVLNIVPRDCRFDFEFRHLPAQDPRALFAAIRDFAERDVLPVMREIAPETGIEWHELSSFPGLDSDEAAPIVALAKAASGANATTKVAFGTEAGLFAEAGIPAVVCGPGSIDQAHKPDEFVALDQLAQCERFIARVVERLASPP